MVLTLTGCTAEPLPEVVIPEAANELRLSPAAAEPGQRVRIAIPEGETVGAGWNLVTGDGDVRWSLSAAFSDQQATWWDPDDEERPVAAIGFEGPTDVEVVIPDEAQEGEWLLCDWDDEQCGVLRVTD